MDFWKLPDPGLNHNNVGCITLGDKHMAKNGTMYSPKPLDAFASPSMTPCTADYTGTWAATCVTSESQPPPANQASEKQSHE